MAVDRDRADMEHASDAGLATHSKDVARGVNDALLKGAPRPPRADLGGAVVHNIRAVNETEQGSAVLQSSRYQLNVDRLQKRGIRAGPNQGAHPVAALAELLGDVAAKQPRGPGH